MGNEVLHVMWQENLTHDLIENEVMTSISFGHYPCPTLNFGKEKKNVQFLLKIDIFYTVRIVYTWKETYSDWPISKQSDLVLFDCTPEYHDHDKTVLSTGNYMYPVIIYPGCIVCKIRSLGYASSLHSKLLSWPRASHWLTDYLPTHIVFLFFSFPYFSHLCNPFCDPYREINKKKLNGMAR